MDIAVYLFTGFLDAGKTSFVKETLNDSRFATGERTLLLLCEEGEEELDFKKFAEKNIFIEQVDDSADINEKYFKLLAKKYKAQRVIIEYNGMWQLSELYSAMPTDWVLYQEITFSDANTFLTYNANMRSLVVDKLTNCELAVFNRYKKDFDKSEIHKIVRGLNRRCDIIYEYENGEIEYDDIEDPLPFDIEADVVEIGIRDYALWYRDLLEDMQKYHNKTVKFTGVIAIDRRMPNECFIVGRPVMTCCVDDIAFKGVLCVGRTPMMKNGDWLIITAKVSIEKHKLYKGEGPVLYIQDYAVTSEPEDSVATFY